MTDLEKLFIGFTKAAKYVDLHRTGLISLTLSAIGIKIEILDTYGNHTLSTTRYISYEGLRNYKGDSFSLIKREIDEALKEVRRAYT